MKWFLAALSFVFVLTSISAPLTREEKLFKKNKIKLIQVEAHADEKSYTVEFPFDPLMGNNTSRIEAEIAANNGCKSFSLISRPDKIRIHVVATKKDDCALSEDIQKLAP